MSELEKKEEILTNCIKTFLNENTVESFCTNYPNSFYELLKKNIEHSKSSLSLPDSIVRQFIGGLIKKYKDELIKAETAPQIERYKHLDPCNRSIEYLPNEVVSKVKILIEETKQHIEEQTLDNSLNFFDQNNLLTIKRSEIEKLAKLYDDYQKSPNRQNLAKKILQAVVNYKNALVDEFEKNSASQNLIVMFRSFHQLHLLNIDQIFQSSVNADYNKCSLVLNCAYDKIEKDVKRNFDKFLSNPKKNIGNIKEINEKYYLLFDFASFQDQLEKLDKPISENVYFKKSLEDLNYKITIPLVRQSQDSFKEITSKR